MAIQSELLRRSITAIFIGAFTLVPVIYASWSFILWLCIVHFLCVVEYMRVEKWDDAHPSSYILPIGLTLWLAGAGYLALTGKTMWISLAVLPVVLSVLMLLRLIRQPMVDQIHHQGKTMSSAAAYLTLSLWTGCWLAGPSYQYKWVLIPIVLIWMNDTGAYVFGKRWGKRKIAAAISPGKSLEGTLGGAASALLLAFVLTRVWPEIPAEYIWFLGILTPPFALAGDLYESALKRKAGLKDSGTFLPGHGGFLDRYDSFLFVLPVAVLGYFIFAP